MRANGLVLSPSLCSSRRCTESERSSRNAVCSLTVCTVLSLCMCCAPETETCATDPEEGELVVSQSFVSFCVFACASLPSLSMRQSGGEEGKEERESEPGKNRSMDFISRCSQFIRPERSEFWYSCCRWVIHTYSILFSNSLLTFPPSTHYTTVYCTTLYSVLLDLKGKEGN